MHKSIFILLASLFLAESAFAEDEFGIETAVHRYAPSVRPHHWLAEAGMAYPSVRGSGDDPATLLSVGAGWALDARGDLLHEVFVARSVRDGRTHDVSSAYSVAIEQYGWRTKYRYPGWTRWFVLTGGLTWSHVKTSRPDFDVRGSGLLAELGVGIGFGDKVDLTVRVSDSFNDSRGGTAGAWLSVMFR